MRRFVWILLVLSGLAGCGGKDPVLARVGRREVRVSAFLREVEGVPFASGAYLRTSSGRREFLDLLIRRQIILAEALRGPMPDDLRTRLSEMAREQEALRRRLEERARDDRERFVVAHFMDRLKSPGGALHAADQEIEQVWREELEVRASHILLSERKKAEEVRARLAKGEDFAALARDSSEDPASASKGGDAGYLLRGSLVAEFENALFSLPKGETSDVVPSPYGFHIIRRTGERRLSDQKLDDAMKTRLKQAIESRKLQAFAEAARSRQGVRVDQEALMDLDFPGPESPPVPKAERERG